MGELGALRHRRAEFGITFGFRAARGEAWRAVGMDGSGRRNENLRKTDCTRQRAGRDLLAGC